MFAKASKSAGSAETNLTVSLVSLRVGGPTQIDAAALGTPVSPGIEPLQASLPSRPLSSVQAETQQQLQSGSH